MEWGTDALATVDGVAGTRLADRLRERRADRTFRERSRSPLRAASDAPDHVVVVAVDCLRADALGGPTPFLDGLDGTTAITPSTWTFPAVISLVTGRYPAGHGATRRVDDFANAVADVTGLPPESGTPGIADRFAAAGYDTYGGFGMIVPFLALSGRFRSHRLREDAAADRVLSEHLSWLADGDRLAGRTFSYLHLADLHEPVDPPADYWNAHDVDASIRGVREWHYEDVIEATPAVERYREHRRRLYRAAVEYVDNRLGAYHRRLTDLAGSVALVVVGDHGEGFWERASHAAANFADSRPAYCVGHGGAPYEAITRVPLRVAGLDCDPDSPASLVDVAPTLADVAGFDLDAAGVSLFDSPPEDRRIRVESARYGYEKRAVYAGDRKLVVSRGDGYAEGFAVPEEEPVELPPELESELRDEIPPWPGESSSESQGESSVSRDVEQRLADLGYR